MACLTFNTTTSGSQNGESTHNRPTETQLSESEVLRTAHKDITAELDAPRIFPDPLVIQPILNHKQTFIILHGRGSFAARFGPPLLAMASSDNGTLQTAFPHAKIFFVTASRNKATIYKKSLTHQWFDNWHLQDVTKRQDMMSDGLKKSCDYIHRVLEKEIVTIGKENFVLWGMSQGCATSLSALLSWDGQPFAATVGMCGWLPYSNMLIDIGGGRYSLNTSDLDDDLFGQDDDSFGTGDSFEQDDDPFVTSDDDNDDNDDNDIISLPKAKKYKAMEAVEYLSKEIQMEDKMGSAFKHVPIFLGHGVEDDRVSIDLGREAKTCLDLIGADAKMIEYEGLGHWYSADMLRDIFEFLKGNLGEE